MPIKPYFLIITTVSVMGAMTGHAAVLASYTFPATNSLAPTSVNSNLTVSDFGLSSSTIATNVITGTYFPNEPYVEGSGWTSTSQAAAKNFFFTITANSNYTFDITSVSFRAYATGTGPSALGLTIGSTSVYAADMPDSSLVEVDQSVSGKTGLTSTTFKIQGWLNGSRTSSGSGDLRIDDVIINGSVTAIPEPSTVILSVSLCALMFLRRRR
jgi:hypothetical protein